MKLTLTLEHRYWWPVKVPMPSDKKIGTFETITFDMQFRSFGEDEAREAREAFAAFPEAEREAHKHDLVIGVCCDWRNIVGDDDKPLPFSTEALREAMRQPRFANAVYKALDLSLTPTA